MHGLRWVGRMLGYAVLFLAALAVGALLPPVLYFSFGYHANLLAEVLLFVLPAVWVAVWAAALLLLRQSGLQRRWLTLLITGLLTGALLYAIFIYVLGGLGDVY